MQTKRSYKYIILLLALLLSKGAAAQTEGSATVTVIVRDEAGKRLAGLLVVAQPVEARDGHLYPVQQPLTNTTSTVGSTSFSGLAANRIKLYLLAGDSGIPLVNQAAQDIEQLPLIFPTTQQTIRLLVSPDGWVWWDTTVGDGPPATPQIRPGSQAGQRPLPITQGQARRQRGLPDLPRPAIRASATAWALVAATEQSYPQRSWSGPTALAILSATAAAVQPATVQAGRQNTSPGVAVLPANQPAATVTASPVPQPANPDFFSDYGLVVSLLFILGLYFVGKAGLRIVQARARAKQGARDEA